MFRLKYYQVRAEALDYVLGDHRLVALDVTPLGHSGGLAAPQVSPGQRWPWPTRVPAVVASKAEPGVEHDARAEA
eukprot:10148068-Alexandrium_andersonii.AAC.1